MNGLVWFSPIAGYGSDITYGPIVTSYRLKKSVRLLNLGQARVRNATQKILEQRGLKRTDLAQLFDPDNQYSGAEGNKKLHTLLLRQFGTDLDGTIIISTLEPNDYINDNNFPKKIYVNDEDLEGATEIVLWKNHADFLKRL